MPAEERGLVTFIAFLVPERTSDGKALGTTSELPHRERKR